jgi:PAS domain S-box-containing protein
MKKNLLVKIRLSLKAKMSNIHNIKVLYVEENTKTIMYVKDLLFKNGISSFTSSTNGIEALSLYEKNKYDLIITDMVIPRMNGFDLIKNIKKIDSEQIVMMIAGLDNREDLIKAIELRVHYFIEKPILSAKFDSTLHECQESIKTKKESELSNLLLQQYRYAIDTSSILSKTDIRGKITYANKAFYQISQYTEEECIGQTHRIIKNSHADTSIYKDIWNTISRKKEWRGIIKNRAKDGSEYIVDSLIIPLLDTDNNIIEYLGIRHDITKLEHYKENLKEQLQIAVKETIDTQKEVVYTMGSIGETRSKETGNHVKRVAEYSYILAKLAGLEESHAELLKLASPMHDIGKVGIPDAILNKKGKLTPEEFEIMKTHSTLGYEMLKGSNRDIMRTSAIVAYQHHEKWNGDGYPQGLKKDEIHIYGRITAICDVFDALGSDRCYKKAWPLDKILKLFEKETSEHFDPNLVVLFMDNLELFLDIRDQYVD